MTDPSSSSPAEGPFVGIVFQGPVKSRAFDCGPLLLDYARRVRALPGRIACCLSTWEGENVPSELAELGWIILRNPPLAGFDQQNRRKQFLSTRLGAEALLASHRLDYLVKIRCDFDLQLELLLPELTTGAGHEEKLCFPAANGELAFWLNDFYFAGPAALFMDYVQSVLGFGFAMMRRGPELDFPLKYLFARHRRELLPLSDFGCFLDPFHYPLVWKEGIGAKGMTVWRHCRKSYFRLGSQRLFESSFWRGRPTGEQYGIHSAEFGDFAPYPAGDFGIPLPPLRPMGAVTRLAQVLLSSVQWLWWKLALPFPQPGRLDRAFYKIRRLLRR